MVYSNFDACACKLESHRVESEWDLYQSDCCVRRSQAEMGGQTGTKVGVHKPHVNHIHSVQDSCTAHRSCLCMSCLPGQPLGPLADTADAACRSRNIWFRRGEQLSSAHNPATPMPHRATRAILPLAPPSSASQRCPASLTPPCTQLLSSPCCRWAGTQACRPSRTL
jgi:hypothetical protein